MRNELQYVVRQGDTPLTIANRVRTPIAAIADANPGWSRWRPVVPGETLIIPVREGESGIGAAHSEYGSARLEEDWTEMCRRYAGWIEPMPIIGRSVLGKPIRGLRIGRGPRLLHANGAVHANEWMTSLALMRFCGQYAEALVGDGAIGGFAARSLFLGCTLTVVPMANPDGVDLSLEGVTKETAHNADWLAWNRGSRRFHRWKANARGVDLNDQFPAHWEEERARRNVSGPSAQDYSGPAPLSEPEARALAELAERSDFHAVLSFHTQGEEIYWNYRRMEPPAAGDLAERLARVSGYRAVWLEGSDAGFKDWFIERFRRPGFTIEAGWGRNPLPLGQADDICAATASILAEAMDWRDGL